MSSNLIDFFFSRSKWTKVGFLFRERIQAFGYWSGINLGYGTEDVTTVLVEEASTSLPTEFAEPLSVPALNEYQWSYQTEVPINHDVLTNAAMYYEQDTYSDTGSLHTDFEYQLAEIGRASLYSNGATHVSVYDAQGRCLPDYSYIKYGRYRGRVAFEQRHIAIGRYFSGLTLNLFGNVENVAGNYGHWMVDGLAQLYLALQYFSIDDIDHFLVPVMALDFQRDSLLAVGIPDHKILEIPVLACYGFERLLCTSAPRGYSSCNIPGWLVEGYRRSLLPADDSVRGKRLYISRRDAGSRKFLNEDEIIELLESHGFEAVEMSQYNFAQKVALFANADSIVGLTGAGLTNLMFCSAGTHVVELFPASYVTYFYASIAGYLRLDYHPLIFENASVLSRINKYYGNLTLDIEQLESMIDKIM